jgi:hypothetical protein
LWNRDLAHDAGALSRREVTRPVSVAAYLAGAAMMGHMDAQDPMSCTQRAILVPGRAGSSYGQEASCGVPGYCDAAVRRGCDGIMVSTVAGDEVTETVTSVGAALQLFIVGVSVAVGLAVIIILFVTISGSHFNPVVTMTNMIDGRWISVPDLPTSWLSSLVRHSA